MKVSLAFLLGLLAAVAVIIADAGVTRAEAAPAFSDHLEEAIDKLFDHGATDYDASQEYDSSDGNDPGFLFWHHHRGHRRKGCHGRRSTTTSTTSTTSTTEPTTTSTSTTTTTPPP